MRLHFLKKIISPFRQWALFLALTPMLELFLLLFFFGLWLTLLSMLISGVLGVFLAQREVSRHWIELNQQWDRGETPTVPALHGGLILLAALFMILPGLLTTLFGLLLLFPLSRTFIVSYLVLRFEAYRLHARQTNAPHSPDIIDV
jgi:UPF0716 protein FxsA